ncbi:hypothetical protein [Dubosiella newyorkensis]
MELTELNEPDYVEMEDVPSASRADQEESLIILRMWFLSGTVSQA